MNENNLEKLGSFPENQPVMIYDGKAYPIGYAPHCCTATAADIRNGRTAITAAGMTEGTMQAGAGSSNAGSFVKVTRFTAAKDSYSAVSTVEVSGFGVAETPWDGETDFSDWNGLYQVTDSTEHETDINKKIFKHPTERKYLYRLWCVDNMCFFWVLDSETTSTSVYNTYFCGDEELTNGHWESPYYDWNVDFDLTFETVDTVYPGSALVLNAVSASYNSNTWSTGAAVSVNGYDIEPIENGIYMLDVNHLRGSTIAYEYEHWMPADGLLSYLPMSGSASKAVDYISGMELLPKGSGVYSDSVAWCGRGGKGGLNAVLPYECPQEFTLALKFRIDDYPDHGNLLPLFQIDCGFAVYVNNDNRIRTYIYTEEIETFDFERETDYCVFLICDGNSVRTYCTQNGEEWHDNIRGCNYLPQSDAYQVYALGYADQITFTGKVWDVLLYNRALNEEEIAVIANRG